MSSRRYREFRRVEGVGHVALWSKAEGVRAEIVFCDGTVFDTTLRHPSSLDALQSLRAELVEMHTKHLALIDAAIAEVAE